MLSFNSLPVRGMSALLSPLNHISNIDSRPLLSNVVDFTHNPPSPQKVHHQMSIAKTVTPKLDFICSSQRVCPVGELVVAADNGEASDAGEYNQSKVSVDSSEKTILNNGNGVFGCSNSVETLDSKMLRERIRRTKIGLANKGKVPWNKGRKHTAETRERIKQRTLEALRDPKVRNKMSEHPRTHSDQSKAKISSSLKRVWQKRLKSKRLKEQFYLSWAESIANGAREGGIDQEELDWNSYDKIKQQLERHQLLWAKQKGKGKQIAVARAKKFMELWATSIAKAARSGGKGERELDWDSYEKIEQEMAVHHQLQQSAEKAKAKEMARIRADRAAQIKAIKKVMLMQKKREHEERAKAPWDIKTQPHGRAKEVKGDLEVPLDFKFTSKLKFRIRENTSDQGDGEGKDLNSIFPNSKKLDLELIKKEKMRKEVSLADQIQAARSRKGKIH
ncbi:uncharacterized protein LOC114741459 isoform X1 [Neltuma alba]|uniref:uncharacterized protein LOC114741459 isoform X1 n=2 Tax=Neltuma alba TaxID=207710 RepID=UPI0010A4CF90|nr:uncharacterized protein LOC114741459 isoform X1 [Prosopis alba]